MKYTVTDTTKSMKKTAKFKNCLFHLFLFKWLLIFCSVCYCFFTFRNGYWFCNCIITFGNNSFLHYNELFCIFVCRLPPWTSRQCDWSCGFIFWDNLCLLYFNFTTSQSWKTEQATVSSGDQETELYQTQKATSTQIQLQGNFFLNSTMATIGTLSFRPQSCFIALLTLEIFYKYCKSCFYNDANQILQKDGDTVSSGQTVLLSKAA